MPDNTTGAPLTPLPIPKPDTQDSNTCRIASTVAIRFTDICYQVQNDSGGQHKILKSVTGSAAPGELLGVMGPSGAGKTSLINVLSGRVEPEQLSGSCSLGGVGKQHIGFVFQDDLLLSELTVKETISFSAQLRLPQELTDEERDERVETLITELGLEGVRDSRIGDNARRGVSGGERKRTAIAAELITRPAVLFCDEPTSGLDSSTALALCQTLKDLCSHGHTVVCTIHQPRSNILWLFSKLLLLHSGRTAFSGSPQDAIGFLGTAGHQLPEMTNPADFFMDVLTTDGQSICDAWSASAKKVEAVDDTPPPVVEIAHDQSRWATSFCWQLVVLFKRHNAQSRGSTFTPVNSFVIVLMACFAALLWWQTDSIEDIKGLLFFVLIQQGFNAVNGVLRIFPTERTLVMRERSNGAYHVGAYFLAKSSADMVNTFIMPSLFAMVVWFGAGLGFDVVRLLIFLGQFLMAILSAQSLGLLLSCAIVDPHTVQVVAPVLLLTLMLTGGFYVNADNLPPWMVWIKWCSYQYWGYAGLMKNQFGGRTFDCSMANPGEYGTTCPIDGQTILDESGVGDASVAVSFGVNCCMAFSFRFVAYWLLRFRTRQS